MLEKPDLQDEKVIACLQEEYGLVVVQFDFLPIGADRNTAAYRAATADGTSYFVKLRRGLFNEASVTLPKFLSDQGIIQIIAPLPGRTGQLWVNLEAFTLIIYRFVDGHNGYKIRMSDRHWCEFGAALKRIHSLKVPPSITGCIHQEDYSPRGREILRTYLARVDHDSFDEPVAQRAAAYFKTRRDEVLDLISRAEWHARALQSCSLEFIVCHSDIHAGNILIDASDAFYIIDWDDPILAPRERDLMFVGGGQFGPDRTPLQEETLFYRGYGYTHINPNALAYYRYERIVQDLAVECEQIFLTNGSGEDREQAFKYLGSNFLPGNVLEIARRSDGTLLNK